MTTPKQPNEPDQQSQHSEQTEDSLAHPVDFTDGKGEKEVVGVRRGMFGPKGSGDTSGYGRLVRDVEMPGSSPRPYGGYFDEVVDGLTRSSAKRSSRRQSSALWCTATR